MARTHKIMFVVLVLLLVFQTLSSLSYAEEQKHLVLDGKKVMLKATQENVEAMFPEEEYIRTGGKDNVMMIMTRIPMKVIGFVNFRNDKVEAIIKEWGNYDFANKEDGVLAFRTLFGLVEMFTNHKDMSTRILTRIGSQPGLRSEMIVIGDGLHSITISIEERDTTGKSVNISEFLRLSPLEK